MKKKFFPAILLFAMCSFAVQAATTVSVLEKNGGLKSYQVEESGKMYFSGDGLMIQEKSGSQAVSVNVSNIKKITFSSVSVGVDGNAAEQIALFAFPNPVKDVVFLAGVKKGEKVSVFAANGSLVSEISYEEEGINLSSLPSGAYVLSVSGKSIKISKL